MHAEDFIKMLQKYTREKCRDMVGRQYKNARFERSIATMPIAAVMVEKLRRPFDRVARAAAFRGCRNLPDKGRVLRMPRIARRRF